LRDEKRRDFPRGGSVAPIESDLTVLASAFSVGAVDPPRYTLPIDLVFPARRTSFPNLLVFIFAPIYSWRRAVALPLPFFCSNKASFFSVRSRPRSVAHYWFWVLLFFFFSVCSCGVISHVGSPRRAVILLLMMKTSFPPFPGVSPLDGFSVQSRLKKNDSQSLRVSRRIYVPSL